MMSTMMVQHNFNDLCSGLGMDPMTDALLDGDADAKRPSDAFIQAFMDQSGISQDDLSSPEMLEFLFWTERAARWLREHGERVDVTVTDRQEQWEADLDKVAPRPNLSPIARMLLSRIGEARSSLGQSYSPLERIQADVAELEAIYAAGQDVYDEVRELWRVEDRRKQIVSEWLWHREGYLAFSNSVYRPSEPPPEWLLETLHLSSIPSALQKPALRPGPWQPSERISVLSDPQSRLFAAAAADMQNGDYTHMKRDPNGMPYYEAEDGQIYTSILNGMATQQLEAATDKLLSLSDTHVCYWIAAVAKFLSVRGGDLDRQGNPNMAKVPLHVNDALRLMGKTPKKRDFEPDEKREAARHYWELSQVMVVGPQTIYERGKKPVTRIVKSRLLEVTEVSESATLQDATPYTILVAPGDYAIPHMREHGGMTAQLLTPLLRAGRRQGLSKAMRLRIGFYLTNQWRIRASYGSYDQPFHVESILSGAHLPLPQDRKLRARFLEDFERTLDDLCTDGVIGWWHYIDWDAGKRTYNNWFDTWMQARVEVMPPDVVMRHYARIEPAAKRALASIKAANKRKPKA